MLKIVYSKVEFDDWRCL